MAAIFELWNTKTGNLLGTYDSEAAALDAVAGLVERYGAAYVERLLLGCEDRRGRSRQIASGAELVTRIRAAAVRAEEGPTG